MGSITYFNKNFRPVAGVTEEGIVWPPQKPSEEENLEFARRVDKLMEERLRDYRNNKTS